jgi:hypothetical protein
MTGIPSCRASFAVRSSRMPDERWVKMVALPKSHTSIRAWSGPSGSSCST